MTRSSDLSRGSLEPKSEGAPKLEESKSPRSLLERFGLQPKKSFGQNFLADAHLARRIATLAVPDPGGTAIEIGAGLGALTAALVPRLDHLVAIERDRDLLPALRELFKAELSQGKLELLEADAKRVEFGAVFDAHPEPHALVGNLPYALTGALLRRISEAPFPKRTTVLIQDEVAERVVAEPGSAAYGALSVFLQARYQPHRRLSLGRGAFYPQPSVDSAVVVLSPLGGNAASVDAPFGRLVRLAFQQRRKQLRNAWKGLAERALLERAAAEAGIDLEARGETLSVRAFTRMAQALRGE